MSSTFVRCGSVAVLSLAVALCACARKSPEQPAAGAGAAGPSVLDLMLKEIDPPADFLWESVATISTEQGVEERHPRTDAEWLEVRNRAQQIIAAAKLLQTGEVPVAHPGQKLAEPGGEGDYTPEQAQAAIDADRATFTAYARALEDTAGLMLAAIEKKSPDDMLEVGGALDEACEQCHTRFWYPNATKPPGL